MTDRSVVDASLAIAWVHPAPAFAKTDELVRSVESGAAIGADITKTGIDKLPPVIGCGPNDRIVQVLRSDLTRAQSNIHPVSCVNEARIGGQRKFWR